LQVNKERDEGGLGRSFLYEQAVLHPESGEIKKALFIVRKTSQLDGDVTDTHSDAEMDSLISWLLLSKHFN
jgi:hypothetical protein